MLQPATDPETKQHHSPRSIKSPSPQFSRRTSPPIRQPSYTDAYSEPFRPVTLSSYSTRDLQMDSPSDSEARLDRDDQLHSVGERKSRSVVVAVDATKELTLAPLLYALQEVVQPGDHLYLLGILHQVLNPMGYKHKAETTKFGGLNNKRLQQERNKKHAEFMDTMNTEESLQELFASKQVTPDVKIATGSDRKEVMVRQADELQATWIILDKNLKKDSQHLRNRLNSNIVLMPTKNEQPKMLKVQNISNGESHCKPGIHSSPDAFQDSTDYLSRKFNDRVQVNDPIPQSVLAATESSGMSPPQPSGLQMSGSLQSLETVEPEDSELRNSLAVSMTVSPLSEPEYGGDGEQDGSDELVPVDSDREPSELESGTLEASYEIETETSGPLPDEKTLSVFSSAEMPVHLPESPFESTAFDNTLYQLQTLSTEDAGQLINAHSWGAPSASSYRSTARSAYSNDRAVGDEIIKILYPPPTEAPKRTTVRTLQTSLREDDPTFQEPTPINDGGPIGRSSKFGKQTDDDLLLGENTHGRKKNPRPAQPLCKVCNRPAPVFTSDAIKFTYAELEEATNNFDQENYLAEGGYGFVYRGRLPGGQEIAVKQYKAASSQGDDEFFSEVDVLKRAQHRNLVILIGYCTENQRRLLVYEFVCNKSLDVHLSAKNPNVLEWPSRWKIAVGAARGLRYLHEECRVGCIVHRDLRPNNILLTHDFVPMVGDFGLARSQSSGDEAEETRVIGTLGYLAPEYAESGSITEKADVYSFGVVLLELLTGRKAIDATRNRGEACLTEWARPLIFAGKPYEIVDPRLKGVYVNEQVDKMVLAAGLCIRKDKDQRPKMSEVLRLLEQDVSNSNPISRLNSCSDLSSDDNQNPLKRQTSHDNLSQSITRSSAAAHAGKGMGMRTMSYPKESDLSPTEKTLRKVRTSREHGPYTSHDQRPESPKVKMTCALSPSNKQLPIGSSPAKQKDKQKAKLSYSKMV